MNETLTIFEWKNLKIFIFVDFLFKTYNRVNKVRLISVAGVRQCTVSYHYQFRCCQIETSVQQYYYALWRLRARIHLSLARARGRGVECVLFALFLIPSTARNSGAIYPSGGIRRLYRELTYLFPGLKIYAAFCSFCVRFIGIQSWFWMF